MKKLAQVVMLPTNEKADIVKFIGEFQPGKVVYVPDIFKRDKDEQNQHLYILSDEPIKEGDWCYGMDGIFQYKGKVNLPDIELPKKIIASTNRFLNTFIESKDGNYTEHGQGYFKELPQPPQSFVEHFVAEYNKGNVITEVMIEYEEYFHSPSPIGMSVDEKIKVNPKDNTITIKKVKDSWSRDEAVELIQKYSKECTGWFWTETDEKWIEENL